MADLKKNQTKNIRRIKSSYIIKDMFSITYKENDVCFKVNERSQDKIVSHYFRKVFMDEFTKYSQMYFSTTDITT